MRLLHVLVGFVEIVDLSLGGLVLESAPVGAGAQLHRRGGHPGVLGEEGAEVGAAVAQLDERHKLVQECALGWHADGETDLQPLVSCLVWTLSGHGCQNFGLNFQRLVTVRITNGERLKYKKFLLKSANNKR